MSETQREAAAQAALFAKAFKVAYDARIAEKPHEGYEARYIYTEGYSAGWDARSAALPDAEAIAEVLRRYAIGPGMQTFNVPTSLSLADAVLSLLSGGSGE